MRRAAIAACVVWSLACGGGEDPPGALDGGRADGGRDDGGEVRPMDGGRDAGAIVSCQRPIFPTTGERCDPTELPAGHLCREANCEHGCWPTCRCVGERWDCSHDCRDTARDGGPDVTCGRGRVCVEDVFDCRSVDAGR